MKIKSKLIISFLLIYLVTISIASGFYYASARKALKKQIFNHLESVVTNKHKRIECIVGHNLERLSLVSSRTQLRLSFHRYMEKKDSFELTRIKKILLDARSSINSFEDISVITLKGEIISSTNDALTGLDTSGEEFFIRGKEGNNVDTFFLDENRQLKVYLSGPLTLEDRLLGVIVIKSDAEDILKVAKDYSGMGETGEALLARKDPNGDALFLTPLRFDPDAALTRTIPGDDLNKPIIQALSGNESFFEDMIDYRGQNVLSATRYIEKMDWGLVAKIDSSEAFRPITRLQYIILFIILASSMIVITVSIYLARTITMPVKTLARFASGIGRGDLSQKIRIDSKDEIGDLALAFNEMTGNLSTARTKLEEEIEEQEKTRRQLEKELTERMQVEDRLRLVQASVDNAGESIFLIDRNAKFVQANKAAHLNLGYSKEELLTMTVADIDPNFPLEKWPEHWNEITEKGSMSFESTHRHKSGRIFPVEVRVTHVRFGEREYNFAFARDITERKEAEERLRASLREKEVLLREIHHRTKNNMQIISSLMSLQARQITDRKYKEMFRDSQNRIKSMALIHEQLYKLSYLADIDFNDYIVSIAENLFKTYGTYAGRISLKTDIEDVRLGIDISIPCGLIISELVSNSLKHAFPEGGKGEITISFRETSPDEYLLTVRDNGIGIPGDIDIERSTSVGLQLVTTLTEHQLRGKVDFNRDNGTEFKISFKGLDLSNSL